MIKFRKPPDKNIDWEIWTPLVPRNFNMYLSYVILGVTAVFTIILIFTLLQNPYHTAIYDILYNVLLYNIFSEPTAIISQIVICVITLLYVLILTVLHEFAHILCYPEIWNKDIYFFVEKRTIALCHFYDGEISRERRILLNIMPIIVLSFGMILASLIIDGNMRYILQITAFCNIALSSADIIGVFLLLRLPPKAVIYNGIWRQANK